MPCINHLTSQDKIAMPGSISLMLFTVFLFLGQNPTLVVFVVAADEEVDLVFEIYIEIMANQCIKVQI